MKLVPLFTMTNLQTTTVASGPLVGGDTIAFVFGDGVVVGDRVHGSFRRVNRATHRADGVNVPDTHGVITTEDGANVFFEVRGLAAPPESGSTIRNVFSALTFRTGSPEYLWINSVFAIAEAQYDTRGSTIEYRVFECAPDR